MKILALDTTAKTASAALVEVKKDVPELIAEYSMKTSGHSTTLLPMIESILKNTGNTAADIDLYAVSTGPGSFTGIRIGVSAAKGLAFAVDKPAVGVSTLAAMARNVAFTDGLVVCAMDARRSQIYNALFEAKGGRLARLTEDRAIALADLAEEMKDDPRPKTIVGDGARLCFDFLQNAGIPCRLAPAHLVMQNAMSVALEAEVLAADGTLTSAQELQPVYLRPAQAERLRQK